jgi:hypothetical protein
VRPSVGRVAEGVSVLSAILVSALREIADAKGFDNIGNWARRKAREALRQHESRPTSVAICEMRKIRKLLGLPLLRSNA